MIKSSPLGGIGRRKGLKIPCPLWTSRFESGSGHQKKGKKLQLINFVFLILFVSLMCTGQILFKKTAISITVSNDSLPLPNLVDLILILIKIPYFYIALIVYALATLLWLVILQKIPLSVAYPFTALAMVIIPILSVFLFNEKIDKANWVGILLCVCAIYLFSY